MAAALLAAAASAAALVAVVGWLAAAAQWRRGSMSAPEDPRRAAVEHVRACCPTLIATLVAIARAFEESKDVQPTEAPVDVAP